MGTPTVNAFDTRTAFTSASSSTKSGVALVSGRAYFVLVSQAIAGVRTFSVAGTLGNTYTQLAASTTNRQSIVFGMVCTTGGTADITLSVGGGTTTGNWIILEVIPDGSDTLAFDDNSTFVDAAVTTSHQMAAATGFDVAADSVVCGVGGYDGTSLGACTPGTGYTNYGDNSVSVFGQYKVFTSAQTNEQAAWASTNARVSKCAVAAVVAVPSSGSSISVTDTGAGSDAAPSISCSLPAIDTGSATDSLSCSVSVPVADSGSGAEAIACDVSVTVTDAVAGAETIDIAALLSAITDSGSGVDSVAVEQSILIAISDSGSAIDSISAIAVALSIPDTSAGVDSIAALNVAVGAIVDSCAGVDGASVSTSGGGSRVATITFSARTKSAAFAPVAKSTDFDPNL